MPYLRMRADQMRFYDRICKFKIAAFVLYICTSSNKFERVVSFSAIVNDALTILKIEYNFLYDNNIKKILK